MTPKVSEASTEDGGTGTGGPFQQSVGFPELRAELVASECPLESLQGFGRGFGARLPSKGSASEERMEDGRAYFRIAL